MATRARTTTGINPNTSTLLTPNVSAPISRGNDFAGTGPALDSFGDDDQSGGGSGGELGRGEQQIPEWIARSSLVQPYADNENEDIDATCFFEPLNYCKAGRLVNGFCEHHTNYMFNVTLASCGTLTRALGDKIVHTKQLRKFVRYPVRFEASLLRMMPVPELCNNIDEYEQNLRLDLFAYLLAPRHNDSKRTDLEVAVHKAYLVRAFRLFTPNGQTQHRPDDSIIAYNVSNWLRYCSRELKRIRYDGKLVFLASDETGSEMRYLSLNKCSIFTQMIALLYDTPYVQSPSLNYKWLSLPASVTVYDSKNFVLDCTKASHGTTGNFGVPTLGDPATMAYFRLDKNENVYIVEDRWVPSREVCFRSEVNRNELIGLSSQGAPLGLPSPIKSENE